MQVTISSDEPVERVLEVVGALYGVTLVVARDSRGDGLHDEDQGVVKTRHRERAPEASASPAV